MIGNRRRHGFSLIELCVAVSVIGILAVIGTTSYKAWVLRSKRNVGKIELISLLGAEKVFYSTFRTYWTAIGCVGYAPVGKLEYRVGFAFSDDNRTQAETLPRGYPNNAASIDCRQGGVNTKPYCLHYPTRCSDETVVGLRLISDPDMEDALTTVPYTNTLLMGAASNLDGINDDGNDLLTIDQNANLVLVRDDVAD
jgi:prepilin-type N-terminal cleavage/methylation domain-containing protein